MLNIDQTLLDISFPLKYLFTQYNIALYYGSGVQAPPPPIWAIPRFPWFSVQIVLTRKYRVSHAILSYELT